MRWWFIEVWAATGGVSDFKVYPMNARIKIIIEPGYPRFIGTYYGTKRQALAVAAGQEKKALAMLIRERFQPERISA